MEITAVDQIAMTVIYNADGVPSVLKCAELGCGESVGLHEAIGVALHVVLLSDTIGIDLLGDGRSSIVGKIDVAVLEQTEAAHA